MKALDIELMKKLHDKVNIIPVIAKADTLTPEECAHFKKQVCWVTLNREFDIYEFFMFFFSLAIYCFILDTQRDRTK